MKERLSRFIQGCHLGHRKERLVACFCDCLLVCLDVWFLGCWVVWLLGYSGWFGGVVHLTERLGSFFVLDCLFVFLFLIVVCHVEVCMHLSHDVLFVCPC